MDRIKEFLAKCKNLSTVQPDSELVVLENEGLSLIDDLRSGEIVIEDADKALDQVRELVALVTAIQNEAEVRITAAQARADALDEALAGLQRPETPEGVETTPQTAEAEAASKAESDIPTEPTPDGGGEGDEGESGGGEGGDGDGGEPAPTPEPEPEAVTAASRPDLAAFRPRVTSQVSVAEPDPTAEVDFIGPDGEPVRTFARADELLDKTLREIYPSPGRSVKSTVLRAPAHWPEDRMLHEHDRGNNTVKVKELVAGALDPASWESMPEGMTAAGLFCAPSEPFYGQPIVGSRGRPVRDGLPGMGLDRGSIEVAASPVLSSIVIDNTGGAIDTLNPATATGAKTIQDIVTCPATVTTFLEATSIRLRFDNFNAMTWAERQEAWTQLALIAADRHREQRLLAKIDALSTAVTESFILGAYRDVLNHIGRLVSAERHRQRMAPDAMFRMIVDYGMFDEMREDIAMQLPGDGPGNLARTVAQIRADLAERGINVTLTWDRWIPAAQGVGAMTWWPAAWAINIFPEGTFMFGGGPGLDFGVVRDGTELADNTFQTFSEEFETVFKIGSWPAYLLNLQVCANGVTAAARDMTGECQGS